MTDPTTPGYAPQTETWFEGGRLDPRLAQVVQRVWIDHGVRLGLAYGDCVAIARTALDDEIPEDAECFHCGASAAWCGRRPEKCCDYCECPFTKEPTDG